MRVPRPPLHNRPFRLQCRRFESSNWTPDNCTTGSPAATASGYNVVCTCTKLGPVALFEGAAGAVPTTTTTTQAATTTTAAPTTTAKATTTTAAATTTARKAAVTKAQPQAKPSAKQASCEFKFTQAFSKVQSKLAEFKQTVKTTLAATLQIKASQITRVDARQGERKLYSEHVSATHTCIAATF